MKIFLFINLLFPYKIIHKSIKRDDDVSMHGGNVKWTSELGRRDVHFSYTIYLNYVGVMNTIKLQCNEIFGAHLLEYFKQAWFASLDFCTVLISMYGMPSF